jgi:sec-independent protein translocase protein TatA
MMGNIGMTELLLIFVVALLVFGAKRLPEIARGLGQGIREFRRATHEIASELQIDDVYRQPPPPRPPQQAAVSRQPSAPPFDEQGPAQPMASAPSEL